MTDITEENILNVPEGERKKLIQQGVSKPGRREILKILFSVGTATALTACGRKITPSPGLVITAEDVVPTTQASISATSEAMTPQEFEEQLDQIPVNLKRSTFRLEMHMGEGKSPIFSTATLLEVDSENNIAYILTAGHAANNITDLPPHQAQTNLNQIHTGLNLPVTPLFIGFSSTYPVDKKYDSSTEAYQPSDQAVIAIKMEDVNAISFAPFPTSDIATNWVPNPSENLHTIGYTEAARKSNGVSPKTFTARQEGEVIKTSIPFTTGFSGALVVNDSGKAVAMIASTGVNEGYIKPLRDIDGMKQKALENLADNIRIAHGA
ncbi:hypothetical protein IPM62_02165 [Candidatus Woesebacteria bacterium]|nr:MAG: hypothetical protein IPM62_02165 [Candidatus Woesebacteria bacterium]